MNEILDIEFGSGGWNATAGSSNHHLTDWDPHHQKEGISMNKSVIASAMRNLNGRRRNAYVRRNPFPLVIIVSLGLVPSIAFCAWLSPQLERIQNCTPQNRMMAATLKDRSITSTLYVTRIRASHESETAMLLREKGIAGEISYRPVYPEDTEIRDEQRIQLTGDLLRRQASILEKFFGGGQAQLYYEVQMEDDRFALNLSSFGASPFEVCKSSTDR